MTSLNERIQNGLSENRILMLIAQVVAGFEYRGVFEPGFAKLPDSSQMVKLVGLGALLLTIGLLIYPSARHELCERHRNSRDFDRVLTRAIGWALLPFGIALGLDLYVATAVVVSRGVAIAVAAGVAAAAFFFWFGLGAWGRRAQAKKGQPEDDDMNDERSKKPKVKDQVQEILTELRVVLPGTQMMLGFQLATIFTEAFEKLPESSRILHLISLGVVALSAILLMTPAAYHRIAYRGEDNEEFPRLAGRFLVIALVPLALGLALDFYVVLLKVTHSVALSASLAGATLVLFYGAWFALPLLRARARGAERRGQDGEEQQAAASP